MIGWRGSWWFRAVAALVIALMSGGFVRVVLGVVAEAAVANRGAAAVAGAVLFGFGVRRAMRRYRVGPPELRIVDPDDDADA